VVFDSPGAYALTISRILAARRGHCPFIARLDCGAFVLWKASNPDADEFQSLRTGVLRPVF